LAKLADSDNYHIPKPPFSVVDGGKTNQIEENGEGPGVRLRKSAKWPGISAGWYARRSAGARKNSRRKLEVNRFESGACQPRGVTLEVLRGALEAAGVEFLAENRGGPDVRLKGNRTSRRQFWWQVAGVASLKFK
jgi:hypothetical protein